MKVVSSDCCTVPESETLEERCPHCDEKGRSVSLATVGSMAKTSVEAHKLSQPSYKLCRNPDCPVVYFTRGITIDKTELRVAVNFKETNYDGPVCYCFNHTLASIRAEIQSTARSTVQRAITQEIQAGRCACEVKNPAGTCCLGDITRAVRSVVV